MDDVKNVSEQIHSLTTEGTTALGICAGSIFLSSELLSEPNRPGGRTHRIKPRDSLFHGPLGLISLTAEVPIFRNEAGWAKLGYTQAVIEFCPSQKRDLLPFADGAKFSIEEGWNGEITARYAEAAEPPIEAWHTECGSGRAIGIGFHPELPLPGFSEITPEGLEFLKDELSWSGSMS